MKPLELLRAGYGSAELLAPGAVACFLIGRIPDAHASTFIRVLGARHLLQAVATSTFGGGTALRRTSAGVDFLHAVTMLVLAAVDRRRRHSAVANAAIALVFAAGELRSGPACVGRSQIQGHPGLTRRPGAATAQ